MRASGWSRRGLMGVAAALLARNAMAEPAPAVTDKADVLRSGVDGVNRMTTDVFLDGHGPFPFMVDTGADHSVVARERASALGLPVRTMTLVHGVAGDVTVASAFVHDVHVGSRGLRDVALPMLVQANIGAAPRLALAGAGFRRS